MAEYINNGVIKSATCACIVITQLMLFPAFAENLPDPTRPPVGFNQNQPIDTKPTVPVLQSILISPTRRLAIITGQTLKVGDTFGESKVVAISENEVVLRNGKESQVLTLSATLHKQASPAHGGGNFNTSGQ